MQDLNKCWKDPEDDEGNDDGDDDGTTPEPP